jgi:hypothetical protein
VPALDKQWQLGHELSGDNAFKHAQIIGAGSVADTAIAWAYGVERIDAVEIDDQTLLSDIPCPTNTNDHSRDSPPRTGPQPTSPSVRPARPSVACDERGSEAARHEGMDTHLKRETSAWLQLLPALLPKRFRR